VRPQVAELARVATFLASAGMALNSAAYVLFVDAVNDNLLLAISVLERRANGDYPRDTTPESFPQFTDGLTRGTGVSCWELFEAFVHATKPVDKTLAHGRVVFLEMQREFAENGAEGITEDRARTFLRPRDMIKFCNETLTAYNAYMDGARTFETRHILAAQSHYSGYLYRELEGEIHKQISNYEFYVEVLKNLNSLLFTRDDFLKPWESRRSLLPRATMPPAHRQPSRR
jgi:hypothetical protein